jgi:hypothetical protein
VSLQAGRWDRSRAPFSAIVSHAVRLPIGVEVQGWPEFRGIRKADREAGLQQLSKKSLGA